MHPVIAIAAIAALAASASSASAQILDSSGTPSTSFGALYAWYDAGNGPNGGMATQGAPVTTWTDASANGRDLVRVSADAARQPIFETSSVGGFPALEFDGDDYIFGDNALEFGTLAGSKTIFVAARTDLSNRGYLFDGSSGAGRNALLAGQLATPDIWQLYAGSGTPTAGPAVALGTWQVHSCVFGSNSQEHLMDGISASVGSEVTAPLSGIVIGNRVDVTLGHVGGIAEVLVYEGALSSSDRQAIEGYLGGKYTASDLGSNYCAANANSTGVPGQVGATGSAVASINNVRLTASALPPVSFGFFITSSIQGFTMNPGGSQGNLCLSGAIGRCVGPGQIQSAGQTGEVALAVNLTQTPSPMGSIPVVAGETRYYSYWYRDANPGITSNFTNGLEVIFQ